MSVSPDSGTRVHRRPGRAARLRRPARPPLTSPTRSSRARSSSVCSTWPSPSRRCYRRRPLTPFLRGRTLAMIFEHPSTRTRISFEAGMTELGGHAQYLRPGEIHLGGHETVADTARVISRLVDAIMARTAYHTTLVELVENATVPVINGLTDDYDHPIQSMTDALTILEHCRYRAGPHVRLRRQVRRRHGHLGGAHDDQAREQHGHGRPARGADDAGGGGARARQLRAVRRLPHADRRRRRGRLAGRHRLHRRLVVDAARGRGERAAPHPRAVPGERGAVGARQARCEVHALPAGDPRRGGDGRASSTPRSRSCWTRPRTASTCRRPCCWR